jgi:Zn-dependent protease
MELARTPKEEAEPAFGRAQESYKYSVTYGPWQTSSKRIHVSKKEAEHLVIASLLVSAAGLSLAVYLELGLISLAALTIILTASFLMHEIAHKLVAQTEGLWAEFRLTLMGAVLTLFSVVSPLFKVISPGAVMIAGLGDKRSAGKISIAGPTTNIVLSMVFLLPAFFIPQSGVLLLAALTNAWMALFNLIPFGILDGLKVFGWSKEIWVLAFATSVILAIISYMLASPYGF